MNLIKRSYHGVATLFGTTASVISGQDPDTSTAYSLIVDAN